MEAKRRRKRKSQGGPSQRKKRPSGPQPPPPPPPPPDESLKTQYVNRKCKLGPLLRPNYKPYKVLLRTVAEEFSLLRQDAINLTLLILVQFFNTQQVELVQRYTNIIPEIQRSMNQINHQSRLADQLLAELLALNTTINENNFITNSDDVTTALQNLATPINNQLDQLRPNIEEINTIIQQVRVAIAQENPNVVQINNLHDMLNRSFTQHRPQITNMLQSITQLLQQIRQIRTQFENEMTTIRNRLSQQQGIIVNVIIESRETTYKIEIAMLVYQTRLNQLQREDLTEEERLEQAQLGTQVRIIIQAQQTHLAALRQYENQHQQTIESNIDIQRCLELDTIKRRLQQFEAKNATLFQQTEIISQQLLLAVANPEGNQFFPKIMDVTFWSHVYRKVANDTNQLNTTIRFNQSIQRNFADFEISRKVPGSEEYAYNIPTLDQLHISISSNYGTTLIQNMGMHLLNTKLWMVRIFKGYFIYQQNPRQQQETEPRLQQQQRTRRLPIMTLAKRAADGIINHRGFNEIVFREENDAEVVDELPVFENLNELYNQIQLIYEAEFSELHYDQVNDYNNAVIHPLKYIRISYRLLQVATSFPDYPIKLWSLIPKGSHSIVHVPLSGFMTMYRLFRKAHENGLPVSKNLIQNGAFIRLTDFDLLYFERQNKRDIWNNIFNIEKFEKERLQLGFGMKTDGHMISILFEKTAINFIPENKKELQMQKSRKNVANWEKGLYPLHKNPFGITEDDRIIGIDPGVRDIVCGVDCDPENLTNKQTTKQHSFSVSNSSYKMRSGMEWLKQKELKSRAATNIQANYDRLQTRNICTNEGVMQFLNSFSGERAQIHDFMKSWHHRENKGYAFSNRKMAQDYIARVVLGRTKVGEDFKLANRSSKYSRRKKRRLFRQQHQEELRPNEDVRRTVVAYGDASIRGTYKGNTPVPVKLVQRAIAGKAIVITVDEFRTSVTCCHCRQRLQNIVLPVYTCNHRKKKHRSIGSGGSMAESRSSFKCYDQENHILHRTSQCPERRLSGNRVNYPLKLCPQCPVNNENRLHWNRDVNAAANIRSILVEYIRQGFDLNSRPAQLSRGQQDQGL